MFAGPIQSLRRRIFDRLVLRPSRGAIDFGAQERVMLKWGPGGEPLESFVHYVGKRKSQLDLLVLKFPGTAGRAERSTPFPTTAFPNANAEVWTWNPPGYGKSTGRASLARIHMASLDFLRCVLGSKRITDTTRVWIVGNSLGCVTALNVAANVPTMNRLGMILRNPPPLSDVVKNVAARYPLGHWVHPIADSLVDEMNAPIMAARVQLPAVFLQSEMDELVLPSMQQDVLDAYAGPTRFVELEGLTHGGVATDFHEPLITDALGWLWDQTSSDE